MSDLWNYIQIRGSYGIFSVFLSGWPRALQSSFIKFTSEWDREKRFRVVACVCTLTHWDSMYPHNVFIVVEFSVWMPKITLKLDAGVSLRSVNFKRTFWCHCLDQNTNKNFDRFLPNEWQKKEKRHLIYIK